jgi:SAM-dependent methyltransferase
VLWQGVAMSDDPGPTNLSRLETRHVRHPAAAWTSFDRYSRYAALAGVVRNSLGPGRHRVLDVGDASGYLRVFDDELDVVSADVAIYGEPLPGAVRIVADGASLPFPDGTFDAVVSSDALEHVTPPRRREFLLETARVSRDLVAIAAPFDTPGVGGAEDVVRRYALLATGVPQEQLEEHRHYGLPDIVGTRETLQSCGLDVEVSGNGNLHDWVSMMLLKHQLMPRPALDPLSAGYDLAYNYLFTGRNNVPPYYRHVVAGRRGAAPVWAQPDSADSTDAQPLLAAFIGANATEVVRQDVVPRLDSHTEQLDSHTEQLGNLVRQVSALDSKLDSVTIGLEAQAQHLAALSSGLEELGSQIDVRHQQALATALARDAALVDRLARLEGVVGTIHGRLDTLAHVLRHPLAALRRR